MTEQEPAPGRRYFTLRELLALVAIIGLAFAVVVPVIQRARENAYRVQCMNNIKQISAGIHNFHDVRQEICPSYLTDDHSSAAEPRGFATWPVLVEAFIESHSSFDIDYSVSFDDKAASSTKHAAVAQMHLPTFICPTRRSMAFALDTPHAEGDYGSVSLADAVAGNIDRTAPRTWDAAMLPCRAFNTSQTPNTVQLSVFTPGTLNGREFRSMTSFASIKDGLSYTAFIGEKAVHKHRMGGNKADSVKTALTSEQDGTFYYGRGGDPANLVAPGAMAYWSRRLAPAHSGERLLPAKPRLEDPDNRFGGWHPGVTLFLMGDGSVKAVSNDTETLVLQRLGCRNDGQMVELP